MMNREFDDSVILVWPEWATSGYMAEADVTLDASH